MERIKRGTGLDSPRFWISLATTPAIIKQQAKNGGATGNVNNFPGEAGFPAFVMLNHITIMKKRKSIDSVLILVTIVWLLTANFSPLYMKVMGLFAGSTWVVLLIVRFIDKD